MFWTCITSRLLSYILPKLSFLCIFLHFKTEGGIFLPEILYENIDHTLFTPGNPASIRVSHALGIDSGFAPHWHRAFEITLTVENPILLTLDGKETEIGEGDIVYINSGEIHSTRARDNFRRGSAVVILIPDTVLREVIPGYDKGKFVIPPEDPGRKELALPLREIYDRKEAGEEGSAWMNAALWRLIGILSDRYFRLEESGNTPAGGSDFLARQAMGYIDAHFKEDLTLSRISAEVGLQENYFCRYFKRYTGLSFIQYLARVRLRSALTDLTEGDFSVTEAAHRNGFPSEKAFTGWCRRVNGVTPSVYKKMLKNE